jgi:glycoside/pentoside/hexuronide:cation symporter, GPH family
VIKRSTLFAFAAPSLPVGAIGLPLIVYLPPYYAGTLGMDLAVVGLIFFLVRALDLPLDPLLGHLMDGTKSRFGRYRPWLVSGGFVMAAGTWLTFMAEPGIGAARAFAQLALLYFGFSLMVVALLGWGATLSDDYHQRSRVFGWFQATTIFSMILILTVAPLAVRMSGGEASAGIHAMGWFIILLAPTTVLYAAARLPERQRAPERQKARVQDFAVLARNPLVLRLLVLDVLASLAPGITGAMFIFYFEHRLGFPAGAASMLLLVYFVAGLAAAPLWIGLARRVGKHKAMAAACLFYCVTHGALGLLPAAGFWIAMPAMVIAGLPYAAAPFLLRAMLADVADADRLETGLDRNGLLQAVLTTTQKIAYATPVVLLYPLLAVIGFDPRPGSDNAFSAILGMSLLFVGPPVLLMGGAAWIVWRWRLGPAELAEVQAALAAKAAARPAE